MTGIVKPFSMSYSGRSCPHGYAKQTAPTFPRFNPLSASMTIELVLRLLDERVAESGEVIAIIVPSQTQCQLLVAAIVIV
jgi:hypothetical protein